MICEQAPCTCNKPAPKAKAAPRIPKADKPIVGEPRKNPESVPVPALGAATGIAAAAAMKAQAKTSVMTAVVTSETPVIDDATQWKNAIRALAPILHPEERVKYFDDIMGSPSLAERRAAWKARRG